MNFDFGGKDLMFNPFGVVSTWKFSLRVSPGAIIVELLRSNRT